MLDTQTKRRIDDCRDILVGKLPDPKAQIEQITIGLIYKFMDDMDKEAIELGGTAKFFSADYEKYGWDKLFDTKVTATQMLGLYSGAIESMEKNPNIPQLFRDIFKNAYLPYRDPETLKMFLKTIGKFEYTHSEKLGDAFEYLLSIMGSQGDAGQFRTPRHIIDFLVAVVDPDIGETILDPACGTAGFLISAYKHILLKHTKGNKEGLNIYTYNNRENKEFNNLGDKLTPDHRKRLIQDIAGYDISPDMVRLSLVNLYLHGFPDPEINEYDTLSSEERWKEDYDVVLANPPFMSPKGGIRPHKRFTIASNRSEVLFVDYIAEHLNPKGKAGIIVPEGVIFQSGKAYKDLRKMLVENHLYAVVSLPAGVFNPYSGVKTSILLMDKSVATKRNDILFVKIDNDGYNLGAQRAAVQGGQLEEAIALISTFRNADPSRHAEQGRHAELVSASPNTISHAVLKSEIAANGDYNLNGERYKKTIATNSDFEFVTLNDVCEINPESIDPSTLNIKEFNYLDISSVESGTGKVKLNNFIKTEDAPSRARRKIRDNDIALSTVRPNLKAFCFIENPPENTIASTGFAILRAKEKLNPKFLFYNLFADEMVNQMVGMMGKGAYPSINRSDVASLKFPLPPLSIQEEIVEEIEGYQKIIDSAKAIVENYKPRIDIDPEWEVSNLGTTANIKTGKLNANAADKNGKYPFFTCSKDIYYINKYAFDCEAVMLSGNNASAIYDVKYYNGKFNAYQRTYVIVIKSEFEGKLLYHFVQNIMEQQLNDLKNKSVGGLTKYLTLPVVKEIRIPLPKIEIQRQVVGQIEKEQELVNANKELIEIFEQKIKDRIAKVWGVDKKQEESLGVAAEPKGEYGRV